MKTQNIPPNDAVKDARTFAETVDATSSELKSSGSSGLNAPEPRDGSRAFAAAVEAALVDLEQRLPLGMGPLEQVLAARIRDAVAQFLECTEQLASDELMIRGSTGQRRPHPLLKSLQELRREISDGLKELTFRAEQRAMYERAKRRHELSRSPSRRMEQP
jgi:hypothetical protein